MGQISCEYIYTIFSGVQVTIFFQKNVHVHRCKWVLLLVSCVYEPERKNSVNRVHTKRPPNASGAAVLMVLKCMPT